jgi:S-adenosylmethionine:tRNA ribosyltransferase-isomerase
VVKGTSVSEDLFRNLPGHLPRKTHLVFNDTRVIRARLLFTKPTGGHVEIFCLDPVEPAETETAFHAKGHSSWKCLVGNSKRWKEGTIEISHLVTRSPGHQVTRSAGHPVTWSPGQLVTLRAERVKPLEDGAFEIHFNWEPAALTFSEMLETFGHIPLPPYIRREDIPQDNDRYQTIYAVHEGSVAAPTAGLHFTEPVLEELRQRGCEFTYVTLHVGAGTFRPVSEEDVTRHVMHHEKFSVPEGAIRDILEKRNRGLVAVGTTATRTLESVYWAGVKLIVDGPGQHPEIGQWDPYADKYNRDIPVEESLDALLQFMSGNRLADLRTETQLMIVPGYRFRLTDGLLTNFHLPKSTLLLLVSAFAGDTWKEAYRFALERDFRFLSYGDACLFLK